MVRIGQCDLSTRPGIVAVIDTDAINTANRARSMGADILEMRIDLSGIRDAVELNDLLDQLKSQFMLPIIVTNRTKEEGGHWEGSESERIELLKSSISQADCVDVELSSSMKDTVIESAHSANKTVIISSHDFKTTPGNMLAILEQARDAGADISKLAITPNSNIDTLNLLKVTQEVDFPVCTIAMGKLGSHTRVVAPIYGSVLTYGSVNKAVAPGQIRIDDLRNIMEVLV
ncbi:MAG: type I 3-dehydroquinate dehydratase [Methanosarcinales archaeon]|nr:type I 3-dehydroquinate dehydratase [Methanosarcinales archaeon]